jgi:hypothetical protein
MDPIAGSFLLLPAFLIGSAFGILIIVVLTGDRGTTDIRPFVFSALGSIAGVVFFLLTEAWWQTIIAPFVLCPVFAAASALVARKVVSKSR